MYKIFKKFKARLKFFIENSVKIYRKIKKFKQNLQKSESLFSLFRHNSYFLPTIDILWHPLAFSLG